MTQNKTFSKKQILVPTQMRALKALCECSSITEAARRAKVGRATIYRWLEDPEFSKRLAEMRTVTFSEGLELVKAAAGQASQKLIELLNHKDPAQSRLASVAILTFAIKAFEIRDLAGRLVNLENLIEERLKV